MNIFKYALNVCDRQTISMPGGARLMSVAMQHGALVLYAMVDPNEPVMGRMIRMHGTGHRIYDPDSLRFLGTVLHHGGALVWHVFEEIDPEVLKRDFERAVLCSLPQDASPAHSG